MVIPPEKPVDFSTLIQTDKTPLEEVLEAAHLKRNTILKEGQVTGFVGNWVAVPLEDFDKLLDALSRFEAAEPHSHGCSECLWHLTEVEPPDWHYVDGKESYGRCPGETFILHAGPRRKG